MKQFISKEQWDELTDEQKNIWCDSYEETNELPYKKHQLPNVGQMINFIGNNWWCLESPAGVHFGGYEIDLPTNDKLCDALWQACKHKMNK